MKGNTVLRLTFFCCKSNKESIIAKPLMADIDQCRAWLSSNACRANQFNKEKIQLLTDILTCLEELTDGSKQAKLKDLIKNLPDFSGMNVCLLITKATITAILPLVIFAILYDLLIIGMLVAVPSPAAGALFPIMVLGAVISELFAVCFAFHDLQKAKTGYLLGSIKSEAEKFIVCSL